MKNKLLICFTIILGMSTAAWAQEAQNQEPVKTDSSERKVKQGKPTMYDFDEVDIMGNLKRPEGQSITEPPEFRFKRLLDLDESFIPEIIRSVDEF